MHTKEFLIGSHLCIGSINHVFPYKNVTVWYLIGLYIIEHYMSAWRYEISLLVLKNISVEEKFRISALPCNILFLLSQGSGACHYPTRRLETSHAQ